MIYREASATEFLFSWGRHALLGERPSDSAQPFGYRLTTPSSMLAPRGSAAADALLEELDILEGTARDKAQKRQETKGRREVLFLSVKIPNESLLYIARQRPQVVVVVLLGGIRNLKALFMFYLC